ncbi:MAG: hypothetical protein REH79_02660 [Spiroplasma sp.]|nr:hypothetical protein [Spiroplasma sp.]
MLIRSNSSSNVIDFLGIKIPITTFLLITGGIALLIFFILLVILLLMYLKKKASIKGYLGFEKRDQHLEVGISEIESEIAEIQKNFYFDYQAKKIKTKIRY